MDPLEQLSAISQFYGVNPDYVIAGGGNTSYKNRETLWIKGSGVSLAEITPKGFVAMDRAKLAALWKLSNSETAGTAEAAEREKVVLEGLMAARRPGEEKKRPSVETLLHDLLPFAYVVHTHPSMVNGLTCSQGAEAAAGKLFGADVVWIPISDPGFALADTVRKILAKRNAPAFFFLQNHGVFVGADTPEEIKSLYEKITLALNAQIKRRPDLGGTISVHTGPETEILQKLSGGPEGTIRFIRNNEITALVKSRSAFSPVASVFTPDHIVYAGSDPLFIENGENIEEAWKAHIKKTGRPPKIAALEGVGIFGMGPSEKAAALTLELFIDMVKVAVYAENFGGPRFMTPEKIAFINNWEAEQYRSNMAR